MAISVGELEAFIRLRDEMSPALKTMSKSVDSWGAGLQRLKAQQDTWARGLAVMATQTQQTALASTKLSTSFGGLGSTIGNVSTTLARSVGVFGLSTTSLRALDDAADIAQLGLTGMAGGMSAAVTKTSFLSAATLGAVGAAGALGAGLGTLLRQLGETSFGMNVLGLNTKKLDEDMRRLLGVTAAGKDQMFAAEAAVKFEAGLKQQIETLKAAGHSIDDIAKASGDALKKMLEPLAEGDKIAKLKELGFTTAQITKLIPQLTDNLKGETDAQRAAAEAAKQHAEELKKLAESMTGADLQRQAADMVKVLGDTANVDKIFGNFELLKKANEAVQKLIDGGLKQLPPELQAVQSAWLEMNAAIASTAGSTAGAVGAFSMLLDMALKAKEQIKEALSPQDIFGALGSFGGGFGAIGAQLINLTKVYGANVDKAAIKQQKLTEAIFQTASAFSMFGSQIGGVFGALLDGIGSAIAAWGQYREAMKAATTDAQRSAAKMQAFGAIAGVVGQVGSSIEGSHAKTGGVLKGAASGAMMGAAIGSILPGIGTVIGGVVGGVVGALGGLISGIKKNSEKLKQAQEQATKAFVETFQAWQQLRLEIVDAGAEGVNQVIDAMFVDGKLSEEFTSAANAADYVAASFGMLREAGYSTAAALAKLKPSLELMSKDAKKFAGSAAEPLLQMARFAEKNEKLLQFMDGIAAMAEGLAAMGLLTQDLLNKIAGDLSASIKKMEDAGLSHAQALAMSAEDLYKLKQAAEKSGLTLDDHTQKLIDDAAAAGLFEGLADPLEQLVEIEKMMLVAMTALVGVMGGQLPAAVQKMVDAFLAAANRAGAVDGGGEAPSGGGGGGEGGGGGGLGRRGFQHGGYLPERHGGYPVRVAERGTGGEYMIPGKQMEALVGAIAALADSRGGDGDVFLDAVKVGEVMGDRARSGGSFLTSINEAQRRRGRG